MKRPASSESFQKRKFPRRSRPSYESKLHDSSFLRIRRCAHAAQCHGRAFDGRAGQQNWPSAASKSKRNLIVRFVRHNPRCERALHSFGRECCPTKKRKNTAGIEALASQRKITKTANGVVDYPPLLKLSRGRRGLTKRSSQPLTDVKSRNLKSESRKDMRKLALVSGG